MANDARTFSISADRFAAKLKVAVEIAVKEIAIDFFGRVVKKTPVDTGRARGSWTMAVNRPDRRVLPEAQPGQTYPEPVAPALLVQAGDSVWISNNIPYIVPLEKGHSQRAPHGMVRLSVQEERQRMDAILRAARKKAGL